MANYERNEQNFPSETESYYETVARQEEVYLEETEEELRMILIADDSNQSRVNSFISIENRRKQRTNWMVTKATTDMNGDSRIAELLNEQLNHATEELITGDSDDAPLSEGKVEEMLQDE